MRPAVEVENDHQFLIELRRTQDLVGVPLSSQVCDADLGDLVEEAFVRGVLAEQLPAEEIDVRARIVPVFAEQPILQRIDVQLTACNNGHRREYTQSFDTGRWARRSLLQIAKLREEGRLDTHDSVFRLLLAMPKGGNDFPLPPLEPPVIADGRLEDFGVRELAEGELVSDRPILLNRRLATDSVEACLAAGVRETGKAVLGVHVRLPEPLPGTSTRIVTLLTVCVDDQRHTGEVNEWKISPEALEDAARIADLRGLGERVLTVMHTHGWSSACGRCNQNANCPLAECTQVSLQDYEVLEKLFPSKATLMPIAGRKLGVTEQRPVLVIHAWWGGGMQPAGWRQYHD